MYQSPGALSLVIPDGSKVQHCWTVRTLPADDEQDFLFQWPNVPHALLCTPLHYYYYITCLSLVTSLHIITYITCLLHHSDCRLPVPVAKCTTCTSLHPITLLLLHCTIIVMHTHYLYNTVTYMCSIHCYMQYAISIIHTRCIIIIILQPVVQGQKHCSRLVQKCSLHH